VSSIAVALGLQYLFDIGPDFRRLHKFTTLCGGDTLLDSCEKAGLIFQRATDGSFTTCSALVAPGANLGSRQQPADHPAPLESPATGTEITEQTPTLAMR
jgi:hypothetical protein